MKYWLIAVALICLFSIKTQAQLTPAPVVCPAPTSFTDWIKCQKAYAGIGYIARGDKAKWATTSWDLVQFGAAGLNVAQPSNSLDYVDIAPMMAVANDRAPRYGACLPIHVGNLWNTVKLPANVAGHINQTSLPAFIVGYCALYPNENGVNLPLGKMRPWSRDGMVMFNYGFGGSN